MKKLALVVSFLLLPIAAYADVSIHLTVAAPSGTLYDQTLPVPACSVTTDPATTTVSGKCALEAAGMNPQWSTSGDDLFLTDAGGVSQDVANNQFWGWWQNLAYGQSALNKHELTDGEHLLVALGVFPLKIDVSPDAAAGVLSTVSVQEFGFDSGFNPVWTPSSGATVHFGSLSSTTESAGTTSFTPDSTNPISVFAEKTGFVKSDSQTITPRTQKVTIFVRGNAGTAFSGTADLPASGAPDVIITPTGTTTGVSVPARSLLAVLSTIDASSAAFDITDLSYSSQFNSFLINCIATPSGSATPDCFNWTDAINGTYPQVGVDHQLLSDGDTVYVYFGSPHRVSLSKNSVATNEAFTLKAEQYELVTGAYTALPGTIVGVGTPNPDFSFTELSTKTTDSSGLASFTITATGTYAAGIQSDFYFPSVSVTVSEPQVPSGGGGSSGISHTPLNTSLALSYLSTQQHPDGTYGAPYLSDWVAIAFAAIDPGTSKQRLAAALTSSAMQSSNVTDNERHAMALEALGIDPATGTSVDYIARIVSAFDGTQIGDANFDNDDIFALFPLMHAGYSGSDDIIRKTVAFILSRQKPDGSWDGSIDMTSAALQALGPLFADPSMAPKLGPAFGKASGYLKSNQQSGGGWGNVDSTSWVQTMINSVNESDPAHASAWATPLGYFPTDALGSAQQSDGGLKPSSESVDNRVWSTAYAIVASSGKSWQSILKNFAHPSTPGGSVASGGSNPYATTTSATSTSATSTTSTTISVTPLVGQVLGTSTIATSTPETATTTPKALAKNVITKKVKKPSAIHAVRAGETAKPESIESAALPESQTAAAQNTGGFLSRFWNRMTSWIFKIF